MHWISPDTAKRLSWDASLVTVLEDDKGKVLNIGRRSRTIPPTIHRALHGGAFDIKVESSERVFTNAKGGVIESNPIVPLPTDAASLSEQELNIDKSTAVSKWMGEVIDYDMAVDGLFPRLDIVSASD